MSVAYTTTDQISDIRPLADVDLDEVNGGLFGIDDVLVPPKAFIVGFFAGYGAVRFFQDLF